MQHLYRRLLAAGCALSLALLLAAPGGPATAGTHGRIKPRVAEDLNPAPDIVEVELTAEATTVDLGLGGSWRTDAGAGL
jgi:hypothetical protein